VNVDRSLLSVLIYRVGVSDGMTAYHAYAHHDRRSAGTRAEPKRNQSAAS